MIGNKLKQIIMNSSEVTAEIKRQCGKVSALDNGWCHFVYQRMHYVCIPDDRNETIRIVMPYVANSNDYKKDEVDAAVNETNKEMKYIKAIVLSNGSISLNYDHKTSGDEDVGKIVGHIIKTLYIASEYLAVKLKSKKD